MNIYQVRSIITSDLKIVVGEEEAGGARLSLP